MMKSIFQISLSLLLLMTLMECKTVKHTADKLPATQLQFGNGGGFAGKETTFVLLENGQLFSKNTKGEYAEMVKVGTKNAKKCFKACTDISTFKYNNPGNIYNFVGMTTDSTRCRMTWGGTVAAKDTAMLKKAKNLYDSLTKLVKEPTAKQ